MMESFYDSRVAFERCVSVGVESVSTGFQRSSLCLFVCNTDRGLFGQSGSRGRGQKITRPDGNLCVYCERSHAVCCLGKWRSHGLSGCALLLLVI